MYFLSSEKSYYLNDESDNDGSDSGSSDRCSCLAFYLHFENSIGVFRVLGFGFFVPAEV